VPKSTTSAGTPRNEGLPRAVAGRSSGLSEMLYIQCVSGRFDTPCLQVSIKERDRTEEAAGMMEGEEKKAIYCLLLSIMQVTQFLGK
jgi:hypothetical protein